MIHNPLLADMSVEDLNQRYRNTYVLYNNVPTYIREFLDKGHVIINTQKTAEEVVEFGWAKLNVMRPRSRWFVGKDVNYSFYLSYPPKKQFHRGLCAENTQLSIVYRKPMAWGVYGIALGSGFAPLDTKQIAPNTSGVFKDHLFVWKLPNEDLYKIYYRATHIGMINYEVGVISLYNKKFEQEILEGIEAARDLKIEVGAPEPLKGLVLGPMFRDIHAELERMVDDPLAGRNEFNPLGHVGVVLPDGRLNIQNMRAGGRLTDNEFAEKREVVRSVLMTFGRQGLEWLHDMEGV